MPRPGGFYFFTDLISDVPEDIALQLILKWGVWFDGWRCYIFICAGICDVFIHLWVYYIKYQTRSSQISNNYPMIENPIVRADFYKCPELGS